MNENLLGYLLNALEPDEARQVEAAVRADPAAKEQLERLRQALEPLALDLEQPDPPPGLVVRTLGRVAEYQCQRLPAVPSVSVKSPAGRSWWRRADVAVAAGIFLCLTLLVPPGVNYMRHEYQVTACANNLRDFSVALSAYSDHHDGRYPNVAQAVVQPGRNVAGMYVPVLRKAGVLGDNVKMNCPASGRRYRPMHDLSQLEAMTDEDFESIKPLLGGCYAYSLGYSSDGAIHGPRRDGSGANGFLPLMSDRPPFAIEEGDPGLSPNHNGRGQNVLFQDGHCSFVKTRQAGYGGDDIYVNKEGKVAASKDPKDAVLGSSVSRP
jgi:prepilin-type processing-associated H-X9-DG protein